MRNERVGRRDLTAHSIEEVNRDEPVAAPLSEHWAVEYYFSSDCFSVCPLPDYLTHAQSAAKAGNLFDSLMLALRPTEKGAREVCTAWQTIRDKRGTLSFEDRRAKVPRYIDGIEAVGD